MTETTTTLFRLSESDYEIADASEDVRGRVVVDLNGDEVGDVVDLVLDESEHRVRCLLVKTREFPGFGEDTYLIPVDAVESIDESVVRVSATGAMIAGGPPYGPDTELDDRHFADVYCHYDYRPFWMAA